MSLSRFQLFSKLGIVRKGPHLDPWTHRAYEKYEYEQWKEPKSPHGEPWHVSFHASQFPSEEKACERKALYSLLDIPQAEPNPGRLTATAEQGSAAEYQVVYRWGLSGMTIGGSVPLWNGGPMQQIKFADPSHWLTGAGDAVLDLRPEWDAVLPVDIKSKANEVIENMKRGAQGLFPEHYRQVQAYIYFCRLLHEDMGWSQMGLKPARGGIIYYVSRDNPRNTFEFYIDADEEAMETGINRLEQWRKDFLNDYLPPRPKEWRWTEEPCKWCPFKKYACKPDHKEGVEKLSESNGITFAKNVRESYNDEKSRERVLKRWS